MLEFYFSYCGVLKRLRSGALGGEMDRLAKHFFTLGYKRATAKIYLSRIARFSQFAATRCGPMPIHQDVVDSYLCTFTRDSPRIGAVSALGHALRVAPERFIASVPSVDADPDAPLLASFSDYLRRVRGLEPKTREGVLLGGRRFLDWFRHHHPGQDLKALAAEHVLAAVEHRLSLSATSGTRTAATSHVRTFLRFLCWAGHHDQDLAAVVPRTPHWRLAHLPPRLAWDDVRRAIDAIGATTPVDIRDRAVLLLLATTGVRNGELRAIQLQDIDWRAGEIFVRRTKGKRDRVAPLLEETGAALADYILRARVACFEARTEAVAAWRDRTRAGRRCASSAPQPATQLVRQRRPINEVADLLGHQSINTTALYVKVATSQLAEVALPFRGGVA
ncbi:tyrosine-type recombinase/integrase [Mesorhizobium sp.]|uniref:tyrosine-type recombinase/integrase n=1 Tax=Mesorhizobium sp. TaxID=1871066 RepID=UPI0025CD0FB9|nr:tyrosine-type recombinase/integrase [Mesorhizobium sp.]